MDTVPKYMIEAEIGYSFHDEIKKEVIRDLDAEHIAYGNHGYSPDIDEYRCNFLVSGAGINRNLEIGDIDMVDIAPTMARVLGFSLGECDGKIIEEVFQG